ncbi:unnamed protein product [Musa acuminata var. zebrina]
MQFTVGRNDCLMSSISFQDQNQFTDCTGGSHATHMNSPEQPPLGCSMQEKEGRPWRSIQSKDRKLL